MAGLYLIHSDGLLLLLCTTALFLEDFIAPTVEYS